MQIDINKWKKALIDAEIGLSNNETIEQANRFIFKQKKVITFNDEMLVCIPLVTEFTGAVIAKECLKLLDKLPSDSLADVEIEESMMIFKIKQKNKTIKAGLDFQDKILLPLDEVSELSKLKWEQLPENFVEGLQCIYPSAGKHTAHVILQSVHIKNDYIEATDNFNLARYRIKKAELPEMYLYSNSVQKLVRFPVIKYSMTPNWIFFRTENKTIIGLRNFEQLSFPDLTPFFKDFVGTQIQLPGDLEDTIEKASIFLSKTDSSQLLDFSAEKQHISLKIKNESGFFEERIKLTKEYAHIPTFNIEISLPQLSQLIKKSNTFELGESLARVKNKNVQYISSLK